MLNSIAPAGTSLASASFNRYTSGKVSADGASTDRMQKTDEGFKQAFDRVDGAYDKRPEGTDKGPISQRPKQPENELNQDALSEAVAAANAALSQPQQQTPQAEEQPAEGEMVLTVTAESVEAGTSAPPQHVPGMPELAKEIVLNSEAPQDGEAAVKPQTQQAPQQQIAQTVPEEQPQAPQTEAQNTEVTTNDQIAANQQDVGIIEGFELLNDVAGEVQVKQPAQPAIEAKEKPLDHANTQPSPLENVAVEKLTVSKQEKSQGEKQQTDGGNSQTQAQPIRMDNDVRAPFPLEQQAPVDGVYHAAQQEAPPVYTQIVDAMHIELGKEAQSFTMQLKPENLGKVQIELVMTQEGLTAKIKTEDAAAKQLISGELHTLQEALKDKGVQVVKMDVILDQTMQDMSQFHFSRDRRENPEPGFASTAKGGAVAQPGTAAYDAPVEALVAASMHDTASVEFSA